MTRRSSAVAASNDATITAAMTTSAGVVTRRSASRHPNKADDAALHLNPAIKSSCSRRSATKRPRPTTDTISIIANKRPRKSKVPPPPGLLDLPDELLLGILYHLTPLELAKRVSLVCRRLRKVCADAEFFRVLSLPSGRPKNAAERQPVLDLLLRSSQQLRRLEVVNRTMMDSTRIASFALRHCSRLKILELKHCNKLAPTLLETMWRYGESLVQVTLHNINLRPGLFESKAGCLRRLTSLSLHHCAGLTSAGLVAIGEHCQSLVNFVFMAPPVEILQGTDSGGVARFLDSVSPRIKLLHFGGSMGQNYSFQDLKKCNQLESLDLKVKTDLDLPTLNAISKLSNLTRLALQTCPLSDMDFRTTFMKLGGLKSLELSHCTNLTDQGLRSIVQNCPNLQTLHLKCCHMLNTIKQTLSICLHLHKLHLNNIKVTHQSFKNLPPSSITDLNLSYCLQLDNRCMTSIVKYCPELTSLVLVNSAVTNYGIRAVLKNCKKLRKLHLLYVDITSTAFKGLQDLNIRELVLEGCYNMGDAGVQAMAEACGKKLEHLKLSRMGTLSDVGVRSVLIKCLALETLELFAGWRVTTKSFQDVFARPRFLQVHGMHEEEIKKLRKQLPGCVLSNVRE